MGHLIAPAGGATLSRDYQTVRDYTEALAAALTPEDQCVQSMPDASPAKWHRAHTTWFFEEFVLRPYLPGYVVHNAQSRFLFNSYYDSIGSRHPRPQRGLLTRPSCGEVAAYRAHVDGAMRRLLDTEEAQGHDVLTLGLHHEQQHQELLITDMLHAFAQNPLGPAVLPGWQDAPLTAGQTQFIPQPGGMIEIGWGGQGFAFDNELPTHTVFLRPYHLADRLVTNREWLAFMQEGGYRSPTLWMSDGWATVQAQGWDAPLYWCGEAPDWQQMGPGGLAPLELEAPVRHISWYEADAFARWCGARLPTETEWEAASSDPRLQDLTGRTWQWTASPYVAYPGFRPAEGAIGEYNGKFMVNQMVLRGGSCATPPGHTRRSYRNFFHPDRRWQFSGVRLAQEA
jgi:ergothioneine biosynthesis protein EgtB